MKRLIYITYLCLLALILISCKQENVDPDGAQADISPDNVRANGCRSYSYLTKNGVFQLGNVRTDYLLIGFTDNVSPAQQQTLLSQYAIFDQIESDFFTDSGIITVVKLNSNATCNTVEQMLANLEKKRLVNFAAPVFDDPTAVFAWIGLSNEMLVTLKSPKYYRQLQHLARITRTTIVTNLFDDTYIVSADKRSAGNALQMSSVFNVSPFIAIAEPNFIYQLPPLRTGSKPKYTTSKILKPAQAIQ